MQLFGKNLPKQLPKHLNDGNAAEAIAAIYLQQKGLKLVQKNYRSKYGEIDLIMRDATTLVFVEVRLRKNDNFGGAGMSITTAKQEKLRRTAELYLQTNGDCNCRFDAVLMQSADVNKVEWLQNIF